MSSKRIQLRQREGIRSALAVPPRVCLAAAHPSIIQNQNSRDAVVALVDADAEAEAAAARDAEAASDQEEASPSDPPLSVQRNGFAAF